VTSFSILPLRLAATMAAAGALGAAALTVYVMFGFLTGRTAPGWTSLALIVIFFSTVQLACLGILGAYVGRIFLQVKGRPLYLIDDIVSSNAPSIVSGSATERADDEATARPEAPHLERLRGGR
jgi:dolichol-phosphate mannosyltransferase